MSTPKQKAIPLNHERYQALQLANISYWFGQHEDRHASVHHSLKIFNIAHFHVRELLVEFAKVNLVSYCNLHFYISLKICKNK